MVSYQFMDKLDNLAYNFLQYTYPTIRPGRQRRKNQEGRAIHVLWSSCVPSTLPTHVLPIIHYHPAVVDDVAVVAVVSQQLSGKGGGRCSPYSSPTLRAIAAASR